MIENQNNTMACSPSMVLAGLTKCICEKMNRSDACHVSCLMSGLLLAAGLMNQNVTLLWDM